MRHLILLALTVGFLGCQSAGGDESPEHSAPSDTGGEVQTLGPVHGCGSALEACHEDATCTDEDGSFRCSCRPGYEGDGLTCTNIDECAAGTDNCHSNANCTDEVGSYSCACGPGYVGDGLSCANIDECATGADTCHSDATCTDVDGSYTCTCRPGFEGNGSDCVAMLCDAPVGDFDGTVNRDITFLAFGDTQVSLVDIPGCAQQSRYRADQQERMIAALNGIATQTWPEGYDLHREGRPISGVRGVLIAGDITENGSEPRATGYDGYVPGATCDEFGPFEEAYGVCGDRDLNYPVYEGYGNHDFPYRSGAYSDYHPVIGLIGARNRHRANLVHSAAEEDAHYAWKWDDIHFLNLNVKPSGTGDEEAYGDKYRESKGYRRVDPHFALDFLDQYLSSSAVENNAQFVIMSHYGPGNSSRFPDEERDALCRVLEQHEEDGKRVIGWIHGHTHKSDFYEWECPRDYDVTEIPIFNVGSPYYAKDENAESVHFTLFRLGNRTLEALDVSASLGEDGGPVFQMPGVATENDSDDENPDGLYGGWVKVIEGHLRRPD